MEKIFIPTFYSIYITAQELLWSSTHEKGEEMAVVSVTPPNQEVGLERKTLKAWSKKVNGIMLSVLWSEIVLRWSQLQPEKLQEIKIDLSIPCCYRMISISALDLWLWCPWFQNHSKGNGCRVSSPHTTLPFFKKLPVTQWISLRQKAPHSFMQFHLKCTKQFLTLLLHT